MMTIKLNTKAIYMYVILKLAHLSSFILGELNIQNGNLTIYQTNQSDEGNYYYRFQAPSSGIFDTGDKYEIQLDLCSKNIF